MDPSTLSFSRRPIQLLVLVFTALVAAEPAAADSSRLLVAHGLVSSDVAEGGDLFFRGTFDGNGRTCGTCHSVEDNQTIGPEFMETLPDDDLLFIAEFDPALIPLEVSPLLREFGLILENIDGMENPTEKFVLRATAHSFSLATSIDQPPNSPLPANPLGWSGDAAMDGTINSFPIGATTQHFTKTMARSIPEDFRLPTQAELDKMEAFMLELGRTEDLDLQVASLSDPEAEAGRRIFMNDGSDPTVAAGKCGVCHHNGGANHVDGGNRNFDIGVEQVPHPARLIAPFPFDGGFGTAPNEDGTFGDGTFNTPPLVEAADTGPFFHNHVIASLEEAVAFFSGPYFANSPAADPFTGVGPINLLPEESDQVAAFLRVLNAGFNLAMSDQRNSAAILLENGSPTSSDLEIEAAGAGKGLQPVSAVGGGAQGKRATVDTLLALANVEAADALEILHERGLNGAAVASIQEGIDLNMQALDAKGSARRRALMESALAEFRNAKAELGSGLDFVMGQANLLF